MLDRDAAGDCKGGAFARSAPLLGFFGAPFLPKQERCKLIDKLKFDTLFDSILRLSDRPVKVDIFCKRK